MSDPIVPQVARATDYATAPRLAELLDAYEAHLVGRGQRPQGVATYLYDMRAFLAWLGDDASIANLNEQQITDYRDTYAATRAPATVCLMLTSIRSFCKFCRRRRLLNEDPTQWIEFPKVPDRAPKALSRAALRALWAAVAPKEQETTHARWQRERNKLVICLMLFAGLRLQEAIDLRWGDIDLETGVLTVASGKGGRSRAIPLHPTLALELGRTQNPQPGDPVLTNRSGKGLSATSLCHLFNRVLPRAGVETHAHALRHSFATELLRSGAPLPDIQALLGHRDLDTTSIYLRVAPEHLRAAVDMLPAGW